MFEKLPAYRRMNAKRSDRGLPRRELPRSTGTAVSSRTGDACLIARGGINA